MRNKNLNSFSVEAVNIDRIAEHLISAFWREHQYDPFSQSQTIFYFYLIGLAISRNWKMPVKCHTTTVANLLRISSQSILKARASLFQRGLINFSKGNGNQETPLYYLILDPTQWIEKSEEDSSLIIENSIKVSKKSSSKKNNDLNETLNNELSENRIENPINPSNEIPGDGSNNPINNNEYNPKSEQESSFNNSAQSSESNLGVSGSEINAASFESDNSNNIGNEVQSVPESTISNLSNENQSMKIIDMKENFLRDEQWLQEIYNILSPYVNITIDIIKTEIVAAFNRQKYDETSTGNIESWKNGIFDTVCNKYGLTRQPKYKA